MRRVGHIFSMVLIAVLVALIVAVLAAQVVGVQLRTVVSPSMEPDIPVGSLIVIKPTAFEEIAIGDDISFVRDRNLTVVTHRVIEKDIENKTLTTQGLTNNAPDAPTLYENVIGVVQWHVPAIGPAVMWLGSTSGKIMAIGAIVILTIVSFVLDKSTPESENVITEDAPT